MLLRAVPAAAAQASGVDLHAFVPFFDLANHSPAADTFHELDPTGAYFDLYSRPAPGGGSSGGCGVGNSSGDPNTGASAAGGPAEFFITYGKRSNAKLMEQYGFVVPGNPLDRLDFRAAALASQQQRIKQGRLAPAVEQLLAGPLQQEPWASGGAGAAKGRLQAAAASIAQQCGWRNAREFQAVTEAGERACLEALQACCQRQLQGMPTSVQQDLALLDSWGKGRAPQQEGGQGAEDDSGARRRAVAALQYRLERKRLLLAAVALIEQVLAQL
jgi:hypothetical protein